MLLHPQVEATERSAVCLRFIVGNIGADLCVQHVITVGGILHSLRPAPAQTLAMLQALENNENTARLLQHEQKEGCSLGTLAEPSQSGTTILQTRKAHQPPCHAVAACHQGTSHKKAPKAAQHTTKGTKRKWELESESETEEAEEPEKDADDDEEEKDNSDEFGTQTSPPKASKWLYVPYQDETTDEWKMAPGIACQF